MDAFDVLNMSGGGGEGTCRLCMVVLSAVFLLQPVQPAALARRYTDTAYRVFGCPSVHLPCTSCKRSAGW
jgi:hypothetical protein